jgi:hypothetical protein
VIIGRIASRLTRGFIRGALTHWFATFVTIVAIVGGIVTYAPPSLFAWTADLPDLPLIGKLSRSTEPTARTIRELTIDDLQQSASGQQITLTLKEKGGNRRINMAVGRTEAFAIAAGQAGRAEGPLAYDLTKTLVHELGGSVARVVVSSVDKDAYYAKVVLTVDAREIEVDSRPSDAIALAVRSRAPIYADITVLDKVGVAGSN